MAGPLEDPVLALTQITIKQSLPTFPQNTLSFTAPAKPLNGSTGSAIGYGQYVKVYGPQNSSNQPMPWGALSRDPGIRIWAQNNSVNSPVSIFLVDQIVDPFDSSVQYISYGEMDTLAAGETRTEVFQYLPIPMTTTPFSVQAPSVPLIAVWQLTVDPLDLAGWSVSVQAWRR